MEVRIDAAPDTDNWAIRRLQDERLLGIEGDFFVDATLEGAHGRGRGQSENRYECSREPHFYYLFEDLTNERGFYVEFGNQWFSGLYTCIHLLSLVCFRGRYAKPMLC